MFLILSFKLFLIVLVFLASILNFMLYYYYYLRLSSLKCSFSIYLLQVFMYCFNSYFYCSVFISTYILDFYFILCSFFVSKCLHIFVKIIFTIIFITVWFSAFFLSS